MVPFGERVATAVRATGPLCAGIDPSARLLVQWGMSDSADGLRAFGARCVEAFAGVVPAVKPQVAFFERHGPEGMAALSDLVTEARAAGLLVIADAKRGDIGSTCEAYADAWLGPSSPWSPDAVTVHPYLGLGALAPFVTTARARGKGVLVVASSSNPEGRQLQGAATDGDLSVQDALLAQIAELNRAEGFGRGAVGAVVGATVADLRFDLALLGGVVLAPGVGAQGAGAKEVGALFGGCPPGSVLPAASRSLLSRGPAARDLRSAAAQLCEELSGVLG